MTTINYKNKNYDCELVGDVRYSTYVFHNIYVNKFLQRAFLVDDNNEVLAQYDILFDFQLEAVLNKENKHHEKEVQDLGEHLEMEYMNWNEFLNNHKDFYND